LIGLDVDGEIPVLDLLGVGDHLVELGDALDAVVGLLEERLSNVSHDALVLSDLGWNANEDAKLWRQINELLLLFYFKERLLRLGDFNFVDF
jgi:hypothetical protein